MITQNSQNSQTEFICEICQYKCFRKSDYKKHLTTSKHLNNDESLPKTLKTLKKYFCSCGKIYCFRQGLYLHKQTCNIELPTTETIQQSNASEELIKYLIKENSEFKQMMIEQQNVIMEIVKNGTTHNTTNNTNSHNKAFNLNLFLNETCKDAMNMSDFLNQLQLTTKDLELTGQDGFAVGIGHSFVQGIKAIDVNKRPLHCSDLKREIFYIKEDNNWEKEDEKRGKLTKAIQKIAHKNILNIPAWKAEHPYCRDQHHKDNDKFLQIMIESMTGKDDPNIMQEYDKIIRNVAKEVFINKS